MSSCEIVPCDAGHSASGPLSAEDLSNYERTGWVLRRNLFSQEEAVEIARWTDELVSLPESPGRHMVYYENSVIDPGERIIQRIEDFCPYHPGFDGLVRGVRLLKAVEQMLGGPAILFKDKINFKKAGGAGFEPHQDQQAGWSVYAPLFITALVAIDGATIENGCLEMANGPRFAALIGEEWAPLTAEEMESFDLLPTPIAPGDVLFFDSYAPHASKPNRSNAQRRILYLTYNRLDQGDQRRRYYNAKRASFPPDIDRVPGKPYKFLV